MTRITGTVLDLYAFMVIFTSFLFRMTCFSCREIKTILCSIRRFRKSCRLWDNVEKCYTAGQATDDTITRRMRVARWITKASDTLSEYAVHIALPRQLWLRERDSMLRLYVLWVPCLVASSTVTDYRHCRQTPVNMCNMMCRFTDGQNFSCSSVGLDSNKDLPWIS
jgi:hypothetical protein